MGLEVEAKFAVGGLTELPTRLMALGGRFCGRRFEQNTVFDTPARTLRQAGELLRLRRDGRNTLTFKRPDKGHAVAGVKVMHEVETRLENVEAMADILAGLGYAPALRYEKLREVWRLEGAVVCLDTLPFGCFVEIEADHAAIARVAAALGLDMAKASSATYHDLFQQHLSANGLPQADSFVFEEAARQALLALERAPE